MKNEARQAAAYIRERTRVRPSVGIILGTGLGRLARHIRGALSIDYASIPNFPVATVETHKGRIIMGTIKGRTVMTMQGRFHYYEGYSAKQIALPVLVMKSLGVKTLIVSNAAGGLNPDFRTGDLMLIKDHINLLPDNPLRGPLERGLGPRFPDLYECYDRKLIELAEKTAREHKIALQKGVYAAVAGPNLETNAEYRFLRTIGADAVGMSTVPEVLMARSLKIKVLGVSVITDMGIADSVRPASLVKILRAAMRAEPALTDLVLEVIGRS